MTETDEKRFFTSDLPVEEFITLNEIGFEPAGFVVGSSIFLIGYQNLKIRDNKELTPLTRAMYHARALALARMISNAAEIKAVGVLRVKLTVSMKEWGSNVAEFVASGTAVRALEPGSYLTKRGRPFATQINAEQFRSLLSSGYRPLSYVLGNCVYQIGYETPKSSSSLAEQNVELAIYTRAVADARDLALSRMRSEGLHGGGEGIIGTTVTENSYDWNNHIVEFFAAGTTIGKISTPDSPD